MSVSAGAEPPLDELLGRQQDVIAELRDVEYWRRLVGARLDLAVAAVTDIDELATRPLPCDPAPPYGLRDLVGIPDNEAALAESGVLLQLRAVLGDLDAYACALRTTADEITRQLGDGLRRQGYLQEYCRGVRTRRVTVRQASGGDGPGARSSTRDRLVVTDSRKSGPRSR